MLEKCPKCGAKFDENISEINYCYNCGYNLKKAKHHQEILAKKPNHKLVVIEKFYNKHPKADYVYIVIKQHKDAVFTPVNKHLIKLALVVVIGVATHVIVTDIAVNYLEKKE